MREGKKIGKRTDNAPGHFSDNCGDLCYFRRRGILCTQYLADHNSSRRSRDHRICSDQGTDKPLVLEAKILERRGNMDKTPPSQEAVMRVFSSFAPHSLVELVMTTILFSFSYGVSIFRRLHLKI